MSSTPAPAVPAEVASRAGRQHANLIGGAWREARSGRTFEDRNPADVRQLVGTFPDSDAEDAAQAVAAATAASPGWRDTPAPARGEVLARAREVLVKRQAEWAALISWEMGKPLAEAKGEVARALNILAFCAGEGRRPVGDVFPSENPGHLVYGRRRPLGVVAAITPWNFPANIPTWKIAPALVYGNSVVLKPSEFAPLSAMVLVEALLAAGLPDGVVNVVHGGRAVGEALTSDPRVRGITFTGSTAVGRAINQAAAPNFTKCMLEMGGKNPAIVLADADLDLAAREIATGAFSTNGQRCNGTSLVLVQAKVFDELSERLLQHVAGVRPGDPLQDGTTLGPVISPAALARVRGYVEGACHAGADVLAGGQALEGEGFHHGHFYAPTVLTRVSPEVPAFREEIFGPVAALAPVRDLEHALEVVDRLPYGLSSSLYTRDLARALRYADQVETGLVHVNLPTIASEAELPYGGLKDSGFGGREVGAAAEFFTEWQAVYLNPGA